MDKIIIDNLEVFSKHGVLEEERRLGQKFLLSMELFCDTRSAGRSDDISLTLDYARVCSYATDFMTGHTFRLIEAAAEQLCNSMLMDFAPVLRGVRLTLKKPWAPVGLPLESCGISIYRFWHSALISAGSNMGDRQALISKGIRAFDEKRLCRVVSVAPVIETKPYGMTEQNDFLNTAFLVETLLSPMELLSLCLEIENVNGRVREVHWGPRTLDLDIIFYDDEIIAHGPLDGVYLRVPHPDMHNRSFVLEPLKEIVPGYVHPVFKKTVAQLYEELKKRGEG